MTTLDFALDPSVLGYLLLAAVAGCWTLTMMGIALRRQWRCWLVRRELARLQTESRLYVVHPPGPSAADKRAALAELVLIVDELLITPSDRESRRMH